LQKLIGLKVMLSVIYSVAFFDISSYFHVFNPTIFFEKGKGNVSNKWNLVPHNTRQIL